jgi:hypothetical protein
MLENFCSMQFVLVLAGQLAGMVVQGLQSFTLNMHMRLLIFAKCMYGFSYSA